MDPNLGQNGAGLAESAIAAERRASPRLPCDLETRCQPISGALSKAWSARAVDISTGGVGLVLERRFEPGAMLTANLASADGESTRTLFLRVAHVSRHEDGGWRHGCAFASELTAEELQAFQVEATRPDIFDRRAWVRFPCNVATQCRVVTPPRPGSWPGRILEVSPGGLNVLVPLEVQPGTILNIQLPESGTATSHYALVRVLRVQPFSSERWFLACEFADQIATEDLDGFQ